MSSAASWMLPKSTVSPAATPVTQVAGVVRYQPLLSIRRSRYVLSSATASVRLPPAPRLISLKVPSGSVR